ncbi:MAG: hypothetical protein HY929_03725 [Euryarchaeota archaeon]|nr:hypothetical protein [Euryarchaeota archaeon]
MREKLKDLRIKMSPREQEVYFSLINKERSVTSVEQIVKYQKIREGNARKILHNLTKKKILFRAGKGTYIVIPPDMLYNREKFVNDPYLIIDQLMQILNEKYYVGYQSAAHLHGIAEQLPMIVTVAVVRQRRPVQIGNSRIEFRKISEKMSFGIERMKYSNSFLNVSDLEKTTIDLVDRYDLCGGLGEVARTISNSLDRINTKKLILYINRIKTFSLKQRFGFILDKLYQNRYKVNRNLLKELEKHVSNKAYLLDIAAHKKGKLSKKWNIIENVDIMGW